MQLTEDIGPYDARLPVDSTAGVVPLDWVKVNDEKMEVSSVETGLDFLIVSRYRSGTSPTSHASGSTVTEIPSEAFTGGSGNLIPQVMYGADSSNPGAPGNFVVEIGYEAPPTGGTFKLDITTGPDLVSHDLTIPFDATVVDLQVLVDTEFGAGKATAAMSSIPGRIADLTLGDGGLGYGVADQVDITGPTGNASVRVDTVDGVGAILTFHMFSPGGGFVVANDLPSTTGGLGVGATFNVLAIDRFPTMAVSIAFPLGNGLLPLTGVVDITNLTGGSGISAAGGPQPSGLEEPPLPTNLGSQIIIIGSGPSNSALRLLERLELNDSPDDWQAIWAD